MSDELNTTKLASLEAHIASLQKRVETLESHRPGRKAMPVVVSKEGVCGVDPDSDSAVCPHASLYRRHKGCQGTKCVQISTQYYNERRKKSG